MNFEWEGNVLIDLYFRQQCNRAIASFIHHPQVKLTTCYYFEVNPSASAVVKNLVTLSFTLGSWTSMTDRKRDSGQKALARNF